MTPHPAQAPRRTLIVGLGATGLSVARHLAACGEEYQVTDTREAPPGLQRLVQLPDGGSRWAGPLAAIDAGQWSRIVVSPGVSVAVPALQRAAAAGAEILGDIELFARAVRQPVVAITGSNGKSTVTALTGALLEALGYTVALGGNFGTPALDLLEQGADLYVLELSSFQLETTASLRPASAAILNISADHLDRYPDLDAYAAAKARILVGAQQGVLNRADPLLQTVSGPASCIRFGPDAPTAPADFGIRTRHGEPWLVQGERPVLAARELGLQGRHNWLNVLASLALIQPWAGDPAAPYSPPVLDVLRDFTGLPHRSQRVAQRAGVDYVDDSKGTNVGATLAAIRGVSGPVILIAGGQGKDQDFEPLVDALVGKARGVVLLGIDAPRIARVLQGVVPLQRVVSMEAAVVQAAAWAQPGDTVLLSPACASQDMFTDYAERGACFAAAVRELAP